MALVLLVWVVIGAGGRAVARVASVHTSKYLMHAWVQILNLPMLGMGCRGFQVIEQRLDEGALNVSLVEWQRLLEDHKSTNWP